MISIEELTEKYIHETTIQLVYAAQKQGITGIIKINAHKHDKNEINLLSEIDQWNKNAIRKTLY